MKSMLAIITVPGAVLMAAMFLAMSAGCGESRVSRPCPPLSGTEVYSSATSRAQRFDDPERGVTCYVTSGGGISCVRRYP